MLEAIANTYDAILSNQTKFIVGAIPPVKRRPATGNR